jgi:hypothetical protein
MFPPLKKHPLMVALLATLVTSASLHAEDKVTLRAHWEPGKTYTMQTQTEMTASVPGLGEGAGQKTEITQTMSITVSSEASTGNRLAEVKFSGIKATMNMMGQAMTYDSSDPAKSAPFLQQSFGAMLNKSFTMVFDKDDKYIEARGLDALTEGTPLGQTKAVNGQQMADMFRKSFDMTLPKQAVSSGDSWKYDDKIDMGPVGQLSFSATNKFDSVVDRDGHKHVKIVMDGSMSTSDAGEAKMVKIGAGSKMSGETYFDLDRKVVDYTETNTEIKMSVGGQEVPMKQKSVNRIISIEDTKK